MDRHVYYNACDGGSEPMWEEYAYLEIAQRPYDRDVYVVCAVTALGDVDEITVTHDPDRVGPIARVLARRANLPLLDRRSDRQKVA